MMKHDHRHYLQLIVAAPYEDGPRLAYADWLDQEGLTQEAEFIRLQVRASNNHPWSSEYEKLRGQADDILWTQECFLLPQLYPPGLRDYERKEDIQFHFRRGCIEIVEINHLEHLIIDGDKIFEMAPLIDTLVLNIMEKWDDSTLTSFVEHPVLSKIKRLETQLPPIEGQLDKLLETSLFVNLKELIVEGAKSSESITQELLSSPILPQIKTLSVNSGEDIQFFLELATSHRLESLERLELDEITGDFSPLNCVDYQRMVGAFFFLVNSTHLTKLKELKLGQITPEQAVVLTESSLADQLDLIFIEEIEFRFSYGRSYTLHRTLFDRFGDRLLGLGGAKKSLVCIHEFDHDGVFSSAICEMCKENFGWYCPKSPDAVCHYGGEVVNDDFLLLIDGRRVQAPKLQFDEIGGEPYWEEDWCIYCGAPEERK